MPVASAHTHQTAQPRCLGPKPSSELLKPGMLSHGTAAPELYLYLPLHGDTEQHDEVHHQDGPEHRDVEGLKEGAHHGHQDALGRRVPVEGEVSGQHRRRPRGAGSPPEAGGSYVWRVSRTTCDTDAKRKMSSGGAGAAQAGGWTGMPCAAGARLETQSQASSPSPTCLAGCPRGQAASHQTGATRPQGHPPSSSGSSTPGSQPYFKCTWLSLSSAQRLPQSADRTQPRLLPTPPLGALGPALHTQLGLHPHQEGRVKTPMTQNRTDTLTDPPTSPASGVISTPFSHSSLHHTHGTTSRRPTDKSTALHTNTCPVLRSSKNQVGRELVPSVHSSVPPEAESVTYPGPSTPKQPPFCGFKAQ